MKLTSIILSYAIILTFLPFIEAKIYLAFVHNNLNLENNKILQLRYDTNDLIVIYKENQDDNDDDNYIDKSKIALDQLTAGCDGIKIKRGKGIKYTIDKALFGQGCKDSYKPTGEPFINWNGFDFQFCCPQAQLVTLEVLYQGQKVPFKTPTNGNIMLM
jgi:hypothetical protein